MHCTKNLLPFCFVVPWQPPGFTTFDTPAALPAETRASTSHKVLQWQLLHRLATMYQSANKLMKSSVRDTRTIMTGSFPMHRRRSTLDNMSTSIGYRWQHLSLSVCRLSRTKCRCPQRQGRIKYSKFLWRHSPSMKMEFKMPSQLKHYVAAIGGIRRTTTPILARRTSPQTTRPRVDDGGGQATAIDLAGGPCKDAANRIVLPEKKGDSPRYFVHWYDYTPAQDTFDPCTSPNTLLLPIGGDWIKKMQRDNSVD